MAENRALATQLLAAADGWLFATTAARYADAVPWEFLRAARDRGTAVSVVLDRVPEDAGREVPVHLRQMLREEDLGDSDLLVVPETRLDGGLLPADALAPVRAWLGDLTADAQARASLVRRTLRGALASLPGRAAAVERAAVEQLSAAGELQSEVDAAYAAALREVEGALRSGVAPARRGARALARGRRDRRPDARARDARRLGEGPDPERHDGRAARGRRAAGERREPRRGGRRRGRRARRRADREGVAGARPGARARHGRAGARPRVGASSRPRPRRRCGPGRASSSISSATRASAKRSTARLASLGVNGAGLTVMLAVFAHTGGLTGAEVAVAGGTSAVGQKVLEAIFGDQAVRALAARAREDLVERVDALLRRDAERFDALLAAAAPEADSFARLHAAVDALRRSG